MFPIEYETVSTDCLLTTEMEYYGVASVTNMHSIFNANRLVR